MSEKATKKQQQHPGCGRLERLVLEQADGVEPDAEQQLFYDEHLARCEACRLEQQALGLLRWDGQDSSPAPALDELTRRRQLNSLLQQAAVAAPEAAPAQRAPRRLKVTAALAASVLVGTVAALLAHQYGRTPTPTHATAPRAATVKPGARLVAVPAPAPLPARVLLLAGRATLDGTPMAAGRAMEPGRTLRVATGQMVLQLPLGSKMLVRPRTTLGLEQLTPHRVRLRLQQGELLAEVTRRQPGQVFEVQTPAGRVQVKGTRFALKTSGDRTRLWVLEGQVRVVERDGVARQLSAGQAITLGDGNGVVRPLGESETKTAARPSRLLALVGNGVRGASARVTSDPAGATVAVDGIPLGQTPLVAALYAGLHRLSVRRRGFRSVRESLELKPGDVLLRDYQLGRLVARAGPMVTRPLRAEPPAPNPAADRIRLKELEQKVNALKLRVIHSKVSLHEMKAAIRGRGLSGAQLVVKHINQMGKAFKLVRAEYALDGERVFLRSDTSGTLAARRQLEALNQAIKPGNHTLGVHLVFRGNGFGIFPYFKGYKFDVRSSHTFTAAEGKRTTVEAVAYEKGILTRIEDLPTIKFRVDHQRLGSKE